MTKFSQHPFSVIMPFYKGDVPSFLDDALKSLHDQTVRAHEVVLIQDGPVTDAHLEVVAKWQAIMPELNHVILQENQGLSSALNTGIKAAKYEWLARMDADDICEPNRFEEQISIIKNNPDLSILSSWITEYDEHMQNEIAVRKLPGTHGEILKYARWRCPFNHMTVMYKKNVVLELGGYRVFNEKNTAGFGEDYELWARILMAGHKSANSQQSLLKARTGTDFFGTRRRGWTYLKNEVAEINQLYKTGLINPFQWLVHVLSKSVIRLLPPALIKQVYIVLRKK